MAAFADETRSAMAVSLDGPAPRLALPAA